jgi:hypothetical protein
MSRTYSSSDCATSVEPTTPRFEDECVALQQLGRTILSRSRRRPPRASGHGVLPHRYLIGVAGKAPHPRRGHSHAHCSWHTRGPVHPGRLGVFLRR